MKIASGFNQGDKGFLNGLAIKNKCNNEGSDADREERNKNCKCCIKFMNFILYVLFVFTIFSVVWMGCMQVNIVAAATCTPAETNSLSHMPDTVEPVEEEIFDDEPSEDSDSEDSDWSDEDSCNEDCREERFRAVRKQVEDQEICDKKFKYPEAQLDELAAHVVPGDLSDPEIVKLREVFKESLKYVFTMVITLRSSEPNPADTHIKNDERVRIVLKTMAQVVAEAAPPKYKFQLTDGFIVTQEMMEIHRHIYKAATFDYRSCLLKRAASRELLEPSVVSSQETADPPRYEEIRHEEF